MTFTEQLKEIASAASGRTQQWEWDEGLLEWIIVRCKAKSSRKVYAVEGGEEQDGPAQVMGQQG